MKTLGIAFQCDGQQKRLDLTVRDVRLLDGTYFFPLNAVCPATHYRALFGLDFVKGLDAPPRGEVLCKHRRPNLALQLKQLLNALEDQQDLISYSYQYRFSEEPECGSGAATFTVDGLAGHIDARPSGYCDLTLSEVAPTGRGRLVHIIDMWVGSRSFRASYNG